MAVQGNHFHLSIGVRIIWRNRVKKTILFTGRDNGNKFRGIRLV